MASGKAVGTSNGMLAAHSTKDVIFVHIISQKPPFVNPRPPQAGCHIPEVREGPDKKERPKVDSHKDIYILLVGTGVPDGPQGNHCAAVDKSLTPTDWSVGVNI